MFSLIKRIAEFIVFRNVFIAIAAVCLIGETRFLTGNIWYKTDALVWFTLFSTFLIYNFHSFSNDSESEFSVTQLFKDFVNPAISFEQRVCVATGLIGTLITFLFLERKVMLFLFPLGMVTIAYSLPLFNIQNRLRGLRDIVYVKIITVALVWTVSTTLLPCLNDNTGSHSLSFLLMLFSERFLFIYAITLPFEIRDRHSEKAIGNRTVPIVYGVAKTKVLGYAILIIYCAIVFIRERLFADSSSDGIRHFVALAFSAASAAILIFKTNDSRSKWYYKFLIDGTMIEQFFLLILLQNSGS